MAALPEPAASPPAARERLIGATAIVVLAVAAALALFAIDRLTHERVERNAQEWLTQRLDVLVPPATRDNDVLTDKALAIAPDLLGIERPVAVYRARKEGQPIAAILHTIAPDGYRGPIELLIAIDAGGTLVGVQVVRHQETPGLGDAFENRNRDWLPEFRGRSLTDPPQQRWAVRNDGGEFDSFTGATITPRAIVKAVRRSLEFYRAKRETIFTAPSGAEIR
jgi:Na+-translocating ferredoxin:NAD+ oxidoreductase subunit G